MREPRKVMVISKHSLFREGLSRVLGEAEEYRLIAVASSLAQATNLASESPPDVIVVDGSEEAESQELAALFQMAPERVVRLSLADSEMTILSRKRIAGATAEDLRAAVRQVEV